MPQTAWKNGIIRGARNVALAAREFGVIDAAATHQLVFQRPRQRRFRILLYRSRHHRIAPATDRDVERGPGPPGCR